MILVAFSLLDSKSITFSVPGIQSKKEAQFVGDTTVTSWPNCFKKWYRPKLEPIASPSGF